MNLMRFLRQPISLRQRLILTIGAILLVFELISVFWLWHESTEQIQLFEQALRDNRNNDRHIMREIREAVASLIVPGVFMVSLTLFICYQAVRRITRPLAELQKELEGVEFYSHHQNNGQHPCKYRSSNKKVCHVRLPYFDAVSAGVSVVALTCSPGRAFCRPLTMT